MDASTARSGPAGSMRQAFLWAFLPTLVLFLIAPSVGSAQVATNITSTTGAGNLGTDVTQAGNLYNITGGTRPGNGPNLFHSFGDFSVGPGDIGNFLNTPVNGSLPLTSNILSRVTGGNISNIYGTIQTTDFGNANLFLVNPSGIVFGPNGSVNVGGSVSFTTAQYLRLFDEVTGNSANFYANPASDGLVNSVLAVAPVVEFGFLSPAAYGFLAPPDPSATITVQGSALSVLPGQSISLVGGKVVIEGGAQLSAPSGRIHLASTASPGEFAALPGESLADATALQAVPNNPEDQASAVSFSSFGTVSLAPGSSIDVHGTTSTVWIKGGQLVVSVNDATLTTTSDSSADSDTISLSQGSSIVTSNSGADPGADVQITAGNLTLDGSVLTTQTFGDGNGGSITANVEKLSVSNGAAINSNNSSGLGQGGDVTVQGLEGPGSAADSVTLDTGAQIIAETVGLGRGGDVRITAYTVLMDTSEFRTGTLFGDGVGGDLSLNVGTLTLTGSSVIRSQNFTFGTDLDFDGLLDVTGVGGNVTVRGTQGAGSAADSVVVSGGSQIASETLVSGDGGQVSIAATSLNIDEASTINSGTFGIGRGGDIVVAVQDASVSGGATIASNTAFGTPAAGQAEGGNIILQGLDGDGSKADSLTLKDFRSGITTDSFGLGLPGEIEVHAKTVSLTEGAVIEGGSRLGDGTGGIVTINADSVGIVGGSHISSQARTQNAGQVTITANTLILDNGSIETNTISEIGGRGGDVVLNVGSVSLANGAKITSSTSQTGRAGDITMSVGTLTLTDGSQISSASTGTEVVINPDGTIQAPGTAGNVVITAAGSFTSDASTVATSAEANHGGDISITAHSVQLSNDTLITANSNAPLEVTETVLIDGQLVEQVVGNGNAGNITVRSGSTFVMNNSSMTTEASQASGGQIEIITPEMVRLTNSQASTSVAGGEEDTAGGNITIDPQFVILQNSQIIAQAFAGTGGNISITAGVFLADPASVVDASSTLGISGTVNIQSPLQNVGGRLTPLSQQFSSAAALLAQQCAARVADGKFSTFVVAGREGLPVEPGGFLASPSLTAKLLGASLSGRYLPTPIAAVTGSFPEHDARPIQLAKYGDACRQ